MDRLPSCVSPDDRAEVEASLVREATKHDAEFVKIVGRRIDEIFNPDGHFDEQDRARRRGVHLGPQGPDGMSRIWGWVDPETRAYIEAATAAVRPGRHLPDGPPRRPMTAARPSAAMTASNWASRPASPRAGWAPIAGIR